MGPGGTLSLIDCGRTAPEALARQGWGLDQVREVFVTHVHGDHVHGLEPLGYRTRFGPGMEGRPRPGLILPPGVEEELWAQCLQGTMGRTAEGPATLGDWFRVRRLGAGEAFSLGGVPARAVEVRHTPGKRCWGVVLDGRVLWTGDTLPIPEVALAEGIGTVFHDCQIRRRQPVHACLDQLLEAYGAEACRKMWAIGVEDGLGEAGEERAWEALAGIASAGQRVALGTGRTAQAPPAVVE